MNSLTQSKNTTFLPVLITLTIACFALSPQARAVCQEGCLTNQNTVLGENALLNNTGSSNTATGWNALFSNTSGADNTAIGLDALYSNATGSLNTATGDSALYSNTTGNYNTANGSGALKSNTEGGGNTATGFDALLSNITGSGNTAIGYQALSFNNHGYNNTATGDGALLNNTGGISNIALGASAGINLTTGRNNIYIGNAGGSSGESAKIRIGTTGTQMATFIAGISGVTVPSGVNVIVGTDGKLGTVVSSKRFKEDIKPMDKASEVILSLQPVTFHYKKDLDPERVPQFGLVAEEVEKVNPDLVARDEQGKPYTVRYDQVNAMLLNEFLKEHRRVEQLTKDFESKLAEQQKQIDALTAGLQKVSAQLETSKSAWRTVSNDQ
jgi:hypothetical protein